MKILLAIDGSRSAQQAIDLAASVDWPSESLVRVLNVIQPMVSGWLSMPGMVASPDAMDQFVDAARAEAARLVAEAAANLRARNRRVETTVMEGRPATVIVEMAQDFEPDLLVLGSHGRGGIASAALGSVSTEVAETAPGSVLVARGTSVSRLIFAEDGSPPAAIARRVLETMPGFLGTPVRVVSVAEETEVWHDWLDRLPPDARQAVQDVIATNRDRLAATAHRTTELLSVAGLKAETDVRQGDPASEILASAKECDADLIVMGMRGQTRLMRLLMGSVSRKILHHATCSVLIVRQTHAAVEQSTR